YCNTKGHWKRSCPKYLKDLKDGKVEKDGVLESFDFKSDDVLHTDVCGPFQSATKDGKHYYITFTDDFSRYGYVYLIKHKSDTFEVFKRYQNEVENQLGRKIKVLQSDRGGEYLSIEFFDHLKNRGIVSQLTPPRTPQLNSVAERRNRTLLDMVRSMMCRETLPISFWGYALETAAHILNLVPTKKVSKIPFEMWKGKQDKISDNTLTELNEPANYKEAMASPEAAKWKEAMKSEIQSMYNNQVWNLVDTTPVLKTVGLAKINLIRIMLAIAAFHDYEIWQMDVKTAFLNEKLTEDVFMEQPEGFENAKYPKRVCKLQKAIYGLKQASRN
ncbi:retrotransposon protein, putative, ty1-copia subclass, partial [Tanacetum coccineum]